MKYETSPYFIENTNNQFFITKFPKNYLEIKAKVYLAGNKKSYDANIKRQKIDIKIDVPKNAYAYNENKIKEYWPSYTPKPETPWQYIPVSKAVDVVVKTKAFKGKFARSKAPEVLVNNPRLESKSHTISLNSLGQIDTTQGVIVAGCNDTLLHLMSFPEKTEIIDFYVLNDINDDVQLRTGKVESRDVECVSFGKFGIKDDGLFINRGYLSTSDSIVQKITSIYGEEIIGDIQIITKVFAGPDSVCNTIVPIGGKYFGLPNHNINRLLTELNSVYNTIGLNFIIGKIDTISLSYCIDNKQIQTNLASYLHNLILNNGPTPSANTSVFLIHDIDESQSTNPDGTIAEKITQGKATALGANSLMLKAGANGFTLAHEIGHAKYEFRHPNTDPLHLDNGQAPSGLYPPFLNKSTKNFMFSVGGDARSNEIRAYQWRKIHQGKYK